jgi:hypothetical protein
MTTGISRASTGCNAASDASFCGRAIPRGFREYAAWSCPYRCASSSIWRNAEKTPSSDPGYVPWRRGVNPTCSATGDRMSSSWGVSPARPMSADCPMKMPDRGAVNDVVIPAVCADSKAPLSTRIWSIARISG